MKKLLKTLGLASCLALGSVYTTGCSVDADDELYYSFEEKKEKDLDEKPKFLQYKSKVTKVNKK